MVIYGEFIVKFIFIYTDKQKEFCENYVKALR
jgi:hypothetical protein